MWRCAPDPRRHAHPPRGDPGATRSQSGNSEILPGSGFTDRITEAAMRLRHHLVPDLRRRELQRISQSVLRSVLRIAVRSTVRSLLRSIHRKAPRRGMLYPGMRGGLQVELQAELRAEVRAERLL